MQDKQKKSKLARALELTLYVIGAGAFGVFLRWLQDQTAFNELGLADKSAFHVIVPLFLLAAAWVFRRFLIQFESQGLVLPGDFYQALETDMRLLELLRWAFGAIICAGALLLLISTETDRFAGMQRALSLLFFLSGLSLPLQLHLADRSPGPRWVLCLLSMPPMLAFSLWLVLSYRENAINPVAWAYVLQVGTAIMGMLTFFRLAGFAFGAPDGRRAMFDSMFCALLMIMSLADERYTGMQAILLGCALMLLLYNWIMVENLEQREKPKAAPQKGDGLEKLEIPVQKMRDFNRLPTAEECKAADEKRRQEEEEFRKGP